MAERPLWDWGLHFPGDLWPLGQARRVLPVILAEAVPNLLRDPGAFWRVAGLARHADLIPQLKELKARRLPVVVLQPEMFGAVRPSLARGLGRREMDWGRRGAIGTELVEA